MQPGDVERGHLAVRPWRWRRCGSFEQGLQLRQALAVRGLQIHGPVRRQIVDAVRDDVRAFPQQADIAAFRLVGASRREVRDVGQQAGHQGSDASGDVRWVLRCRRAVHRIVDPSSDRRRRPDREQVLVATSVGADDIVAHVRATECDQFRHGRRAQHHKLQDIGLVGHGSLLGLGGWQHPKDADVDREIPETLARRKISTLGYSKMWARSHPHVATSMATQGFHQCVKRATAQTSIMKNT